jgi:hypothetical protein
MRVLTPVIEIAALPVFHPGQHLALGSGVAFQLVRDEHAGHIAQAFEQLLEELLGRLLVAATLHEDIEDVVVLIHGSPEVIARTIDGQKRLSFEGRIECRERLGGLLKYYHRKAA